MPLSLLQMVPIALISVVLLEPAVLAVVRRTPDSELE